MRSFLRPSIGRAFAPRSLVAMLLLCLAPQDAFAYVDPGVGLLFIQSVLAVIGGTIFFLKDPIAGCKRVWARFISKTKEREE